jgi:hypothetical protein
MLTITVWENLGHYLVLSHIIAEKASVTGLVEVRLSTLDLKVIVQIVTQWTVMESII